MAIYHVGWKTSLGGVSEGQPRGQANNATGLQMARLNTVLCDLDTNMGEDKVPPLCMNITEIFNKKWYNNTIVVVENVKLCEELYWLYSASI